MAKFSIILPVRNGGHYVKECVESVLSQTYSDFNFIILDNCSTDGTLDWLLTLADSRIKILPSDISLSIEESWSRIIAIEKNEFITLIGHDDILYPTFLQTIDSLIQKHPSATLFHTHFNFINANGKTIRGSQKMKHVYNGHELLQHFLLGSIDLMGTGYVMRSKDYDEAGGIPLTYPNLLFADFELWLRLTNKGYLVVDENTCFAFRIHQSTTNTSLDFKLHNALKIFTDFLAGLIKTNTKDEEIIHLYGANFLLRYCNSYAHRLLRTPIEKRNGLTVEQFMEQTKLMASSLQISELYHPEKKASLLLAKAIDKNAVLRKMFLFFKKIYPKPIL